MVIRPRGVTDAGRPHCFAAGVEEQRHGQVDDLQRRVLVLHRRNNRSVAVVRACFVLVTSL